MDSQGKAMRVQGKRIDFQREECVFKEKQWIFKVKSAWWRKNNTYSRPRMCDEGKTIDIQGQECA